MFIDRTVYCNLLLSNTLVKNSFVLVEFPVLVVVLYSKQGCCYFLVQATSNPDKDAHTIAHTLL